MGSNRHREERVLFQKVSCFGRVSIAEEGNGVRDYCIVLLKRSIFRRREFGELAARLLADIAWHRELREIRTHVSPGTTQLHHITKEDTEDREVQLLLPFRCNEFYHAYRGGDRGGSDSFY
jgi:hypothetical protein